MGYDAESDEAERSFDENSYVGVGRGSNADESIRAALDDAWRKAKADGKQGKPLRVMECYVGGQNPIDWCKIVLVDENP
jgi:hypothetical protein